MACFTSERGCADAGLGWSLSQAANYLNIKGLLDLTCQTVAQMIKGKTPEEIRKTFNIKVSRSSRPSAQAGGRGTCVPGFSTLNLTSSRKNSGMDISVCRGCNRVFLAEGDLRDPGTAMRGPCFSFCGFLCSLIQCGRMLTSSAPPPCCNAALPRVCKNLRMTSHPRRRRRSAVRISGRLTKLPPTVAQQGAHLYGQAISLYRSATR
jgi:hypothetical protein